MTVIVDMWNYPTLDFDRYLLDLTKGDNILYDRVRKKCIHPMFDICFYFEDDRYYSDSKIGCIDLFRYLMEKYGTEMFHAEKKFDWYIKMSFNLAITILKNPNSISCFEKTKPFFCEVYDRFLRELLEHIREKLESFVEVIKSEEEQKRLQLAWEKDKEQVELKRKKEQEQLKLQQEQLELEQKKEQEQLKLQQEQHKKEKEDNEKKLKQSKIDTIVSYFFNRNLN